MAFKWIHTLLAYFNSILVALASVFLFYLLHWSSSHESVWDYAFERTCTRSSNIIACSVLYGMLENVLFFGAMYGSYKLIMSYYWKWRYQSDISNLINQMSAIDKSKRLMPIEESTKNMGYKIDPLIITFPWLISPILKWNYLTNFLIQLSYYITIHNLDVLPSEDSTTSTFNDGTTSPSPLSTTLESSSSSPWTLSYSDVEIIELHWPKVVNPFAADYDFQHDVIGQYSVFRTFWSFVICSVLDYLLWKQSYGLKYLFEDGINRVMQKYTTEHCCMINDLLLSHVQYIKDLADLIVSFHGDKPLEQFVVIKVKLHECFRYFKLELIFNILTLFTVLASSLRIYYTPVMVNLMNPICYMVGVLAFVLFVIILVFNGVGSDALHLVREMDQVFKYGTEIGVIVLNVVWMVIVWRNMRHKKAALIQQHQASLVKEFLGRYIEQRQDDLISF